MGCPAYMGYVPDGLTKEQYEKIKKRDKDAAALNKARVGVNRFRSRSMQAFQEAMERGEAGQNQVRRHPIHAAPWRLLGQLRCEGCKETEVERGGQEVRRRRLQEGAEYLHLRRCIDLRRQGP